MNLDFEKSRSFVIIGRRKDEEKQLEDDQEENGVDGEIMDHEMKPMDNIEERQRRVVSASKAGTARPNNFEK